MPGERSDRSSALNRLAERRALAPLIEPPSAVFFIGFALGTVAAIVAILVALIP
ncbi:MAG TPA: hypothetical protein VND98_08995 [Solirubrobacterales bacterium]|nr:hypothetical protein [Solirubrobacterales bacterium]